MSLNAKKVAGNSKFKRPDPVEAGTYPARLVQIVSLGMQAQRAFKGEEKAPKIDLYLTYELVDEFLVDEEGNELHDKPRWISETIPLNNLNSDLAKSTKRYFALDPTSEHDGDFSALGGTPCMLTVSVDVSKSDPTVSYNNIASVQAMRPKDAAKMPELKNPVKVFDFDEPDMTVYFSLPEWLQKKITESLEYEGSPLQALVDAGNPNESEEKPKTTKKSQKQEELNDSADEEDDGEW